MAVANKDSASAVARVLGVNRSTFVRGIQAFEDSQSIRIFEHLPTGYRLTDKGWVFLDTARTIETAIDDLERKMIGKQDHPEGLIKITTTDGLPCYLADASSKNYRVQSEPCNLNVKK